MRPSSRLHELPRLGRATAIVMAVLLLGCRPDAAAPTVPAPASTETAPAPRLDHQAAPVAGARVEQDDPSPPATGLPLTCTIELELLVPSDAHGLGASEVSADAAKQAAWAQACAGLRKAANLDCHDDAHVGTLLQKSSTTRAGLDGGEKAHYEFEVVLGARTTATGFGDAESDRAEACRRAKAHACDQLVKGPCPEHGVRVVSVDGKPPRPATVEPSPVRPPPRPTL